MFEAKKTHTTMRVRIETKNRVIKLKTFENNTDDKVLTLLLDNEERKTPFVPPKEFVKLTDWEREQLMRHRAEEAKTTPVFIEEEITALAEELGLDKDELMKRHHEIMRKSNIGPKGALAMLKLRLEKP